MSNQRKPLEGIRVVELANYVAAPSAGHLLSDWGAEVIHVEGLSGDLWRFYGINVKCPIDEAENPMFDVYNFHKKDILLDIKKPEGLDILFRLLETADVFLTNNRQKALVRSGLDYDTIKDRYPKLIYAMITGYGFHGPEADEPGYDTVAFFARSGMLADAAAPNGYPVYPAGAMGDIATGTALFGAICAALYGREKTGKGDLVDVSLLGNAAWLLGAQAIMTQECYGEVYPKRREDMNPMVTYYQCRDGEWLMISITQYNRHFKFFCEALELPELAADPRCATNVALIQNCAEIYPLLEAAFARFDSDEMIKRLSEKEIVVTRLRHYRELAQDQQALANDYMRKVVFESGHEAVLPMPPMHSRQKGQLDFQRGPLMGEHTDELLLELGYTRSEVESLKANDIVRQHS